MFGKEQKSIRTERVTPFKVCGAIQNNFFGKVLLSLGLLWNAEDYHSNFVPCRTPRNDRA